MASLTGNLVAETYKALLKTIDNDILTASEKQITDGLGGGSNVFIDSQGFLRANKYKVTNGLATQFLKADGSLDSNAYLTSITGAQVITALGFTPVTNQRTLTINGVTYNLTADRSWTVEGTAAVWGNITGTLSNQTDLQNALNAKYNVPAGTISQYIRGDGTLATFPTLPGGLPIGGTSGQILAKIDATDYNTHWIDNFATQTKNEVKLGQTLAKGAAVYVSSANGTNMIVSAASNTSEALSSKTFGLLETGGVTNDLVKCVTFGLLAGLDTSTAQAGDPVWLGVNGALIFGLANKPYAPKHLVYIGVVTRVQSNNGEIFVNIQNGFELKEIHDVYIADPANNHGLFYDIADGLWKNKSIATALGYTPQAQLSGTGFVKASGTTISYDNSTYLTTGDAASTYLALTGGTLTGSITATSFVKTGGTSTQYLKADGSVAEITGDIISGAGSAGYVPKWTSAIVLGSSLLYDNGTSMSIGTLTLNYGGYGRTLTGSGFAATSFGFEAVTGSTTNGGLIGGLSLVIANNDSSRRIGSQIQSYISGATATNQGADLRFYVKPDAGVLLEIVRMTSAGITFNKDLTATNITATAFIKSGGTSSQFLMADGSVSTLLSPVTGSGSAGYIPKWTTAANIGSSIIYEDVSIGIAYTTPNKGGYGRTLSGAAFGSASFGFEAVSNTTTNGGLIGGLSFIVNQNDSSRIVGSAIQSNLVGTTATNYGADLRFFAKADGVFTIAEVARMTSAGLRVYGTIVKDGGTSSQYLMADGSVSTGPNLSGYALLNGNTANQFSAFEFSFANTQFNPSAAARSTIDPMSLKMYNNYFSGTGLGSDYGTIMQYYSLSGHVESQVYYDASGGSWYRTAAYNGNYGGWQRYLTDANFTNWALSLSGGTLTGSLIMSGDTHTTYGPNSNWASYLRVGGNGRTVSGNAYASVVTTNGNLHLDAGDARATYINYYGGTAGIAFGTGAGAVVASVDASGNIWKGGTIGSGTQYVFNSGTWGINITGNAATASLASSVSWPNVTAKPDAIFYYQGFTLDANTMSTNASGFTYSVNAPYTGPIMRVGDGNYSLQFNAGYGGGGQIAFRTRNGDTGTFNSWFNFITSANISSQKVAALTGANYIDQRGSNGSWNADFAATPAGSMSYGGDLGAQPAGGPGGSWWIQENFRHTNASNTWGVQVAWGWEDNANRLATRSISAGVYGGWNYYLHNNNYTTWTINRAGDVVRGIINFATNQGGYLGVLDSARLQVYSESNNSAFMSFHKAGNYAVNFGLDADNVMRIGGWSAAANRWQLDMSGNQTVAGSSTATSFFESSDFRLKTLIEHNPIVVGIENLQAKLYEKNGKIELGYFAQDAELIMPYAVTKNADGFLNLSYREVHTAKIARLEQRVAELEKQLNLN